MCFAQVLLLVFGVCFLCSELLALSKERWSYLRQGRHYLQLLVILLCLGVCGLHFTFLSLSANQLRHHRRHRHAFTDFHKVALIAETASNLAAVLLSILTIKVPAPPTGQNKGCRRGERTFAYKKFFSHSVFSQCQVFN